MGRRTATWLGAVLVVLIVGLVVAIGSVLTSRGSTNERLTAAQHEVAAAARAETLAFLTVDYRNMGPLVEAVLDGATGEFAKQYGARREELEREAVRTEATSTAEVVSLGIGDQDDGNATVLVAANSRVTNTRTGDEGEVRYYRLRLELVRDGERWLTSDVQFVR